MRRRHHVVVVVVAVVVVVVVVIVVVVVVVVVAFVRRVTSEKKWASVHFISDKEFCLRKPFSVPPLNFNIGQRVNCLFLVINALLVFI